MLEFAKRTNASCSSTIPTAASGALHARPIFEKYGVLKSLTVALPFICIGAMISMNGAAFLEEHDIFVPEDDD
ncbi:unnamed protein product [Schistocephalus solidus]|uniref:Essential MCU regulator, mitochondrial n=1 Tax=Schistocephalus solidus TaxID=70667 RepID=A0A183SXY2_SCHSO|nr:unnamed protein product [Schistocephalus solidus]